MAILTGFPQSRQISHYVNITNRDFASGPERCPKIVEHLHKQNERVRAALVVYALNVMEDLNLKSTPDLMRDCIEVGEEMYARYKFEKHGPYGDYIQMHLKRLLQEKDYYAKVISRNLFG